LEQTDRRRISDEQNSATFSAFIVDALTIGTGTYALLVVFPHNDIVHTTLRFDYRDVALS